MSSVMVRLARRRALRVLVDFEFAELHLERAEMNETPMKRLADADDELDGLDGLHDADDTG